MKLSLILPLVLIVGCAATNRSTSHAADATTLESQTGLVGALWGCEESNPSSRTTMSASFYFLDVDGDLAQVETNWGKGEAVAVHQTLEMTLTELESLPPRLRAQGRSLGTILSLDIVLPEAVTGTAVIENTEDNTLVALDCTKRAQIDLPVFTEESLIDEMVGQFEASSSFDLIQNELNKLQESGHQEVNFRWVHVVSQNGSEEKRFKGGKLGLGARLKFFYQMDMKSLGVVTINGKQYSKIQQPIISVEVMNATYNSRTQSYAFPIHRVTVLPNVGYLPYTGFSSTSGG